MPSDREVATTRSADYRPAPPEAQSRVSRLIVRIEITFALLLGAAVMYHHYRSTAQENKPIKIARATSTIPEHFFAGGGRADSTADAEGADPAKGEVLFMQTCTSCHGQKGQGMPHQGVSLRVSRFVAGKNDRQLVAFLKNGRKPTDPQNSTGLLMPPRGGNLTLDDDALADIVAFLRQVQRETTLEAAISNEPATRPVAGLDVHP